jgi:hypothetical protein
MTSNDKNQTKNDERIEETIKTPTDEVDKVNEPNTTDQSTKGVPRFVTSNKLDKYFEKALGLLASAGSGLIAVIGADYRNLLQPNATYALRIAAIAIAVLAFFSPIFEISPSGFTGWLLTIGFNLSISVGFLIVGEVLLIQTEIHAALTRVINAQNSLDKDPMDG